MRMIFSSRKLWVILLGCILAAGYLITVPSSQTAQVLQSGSQGAGEENSAEQSQRLMIEQRPLVRAARIIRWEVERGQYAGYASVVIEDKGVALWWKGAMPRRMAEAVAEAAMIAPVRIARAEHSLAELKAAAAQIRAHVFPGSTVQAIKFDPTGAGLILSVDERNAAKALFDFDPQQATSFITQSLPEVDVPMRVTFEAPLTPVSRDNDQSPWSGGARIVNTTIGAGCTSGFGVRNGSGNHILTAGHCGSPGHRFTDGQGEFIGNVGPRNQTHDVLLIPTPNANNRIYVGGANSNTTKLVSGFDNVFIGELLCQSGVTSANATGAPVCNLRVLFFYQDPEDLVEAEQINGQIAARPGDSGGPVYSDQGGSVIAKGTTTRVAGSRLGFQDFITANRDFGVEIANPGGGAGVVFFQDIQFGGASSQPLARGDYTLSQLQARGMQNDWASSVRVPSGFTVIMFQHNNFLGTSWTLTSDTPNFVTLSPNANDQVSSVRIQ
jgi:streptogrisin D